MNQSSLEQLKNFSTIVADTGDLESIKKFHPRDATTNPSLILKATCQDQYKEILDKTVTKNRNQPIEFILNNIIVNFGTEILKLINGRVSSEVDARYSFDVQNTIKCAENIIELYEQNGISRERVLIKIAATWEGITAAEMLEKKGIHCNLTLIFSLGQAVACAKKKVTLISPFVGRILDWYKKNDPQTDYSTQDPGVESVTEIFKHYKSHGFNTEIMGASFRNIDEILSLAGCDLLTISPTLLKELEQSNKQVTRTLSLENFDSQNEFDEKSVTTESGFRFALNESAMATEKLSEGIRVFAKDIRKLEDIINQKL